VLFDFQSTNSGIAINKPGGPLVQLQINRICCYGSLHGHVSSMLACGLEKLRCSNPGEERMAVFPHLDTELQSSKA
jgi:hypothetical protein